MIGKLRLNPELLVQSAVLTFYSVTPELDNEVDYIMTVETGDYTKTIPPAYVQHVFNVNLSKYLKKYVVRPKSDLLSYMRDNYNGQNESQQHYIKTNLALGEIFIDDQPDHVLDFDYSIWKRIQLIEDDLAFTDVFELQNVDKAIRQFSITPKEFKIINREMSILTHQGDEIEEYYLMIDKRSDRRQNSYLTIRYRNIGDVSGSTVLWYSDRSDYQHYGIADLNIPSADFEFLIEKYGRNFDYFDLNRWISVYQGE